MDSPSLTIPHQPMQQDIDVLQWYIDGFLKERSFLAKDK